MEDQDFHLRFFHVPTFDDQSRNLTDDFWLDSVDVEDVLAGASGLPSIEEASGNADTESKEDGSSNPRGDKPKSSKERRREWNRTNARKSRMRKKFYVETLIKQAGKLEKENDMLRRIIQVESEKRGIDASEVLGFSGATTPSSALVAPLPRGVDTMPNGSTLLEGPDFSLISQISESQRHFLITDPNREDNPIVFASQGFYDLTLYPPNEVIGFNCRFLQGKDTDRTTVARMRQDINRGVDINCVVLNYKKDGTPFWNDLFISPLRDPSGRVVHFVGVQANVSSDQAKQLLLVKEKAKLSAELLIKKHSTSTSADADEDSTEQVTSTVVSEYPSKRQRVPSSAAEFTKSGMLAKAPHNAPLMSYQSAPAPHVPSSMASGMHGAWSGAMAPMPPGITAGQAQRPGTMGTFPLQQVGTHAYMKQQNSGLPYPPDFTQVNPRPFH